MSSADNLCTNSMDPDQDRRFVAPDLDPQLFDTLTVFVKDFLKKRVNFEKKVSKCFRAYVQLWALSRRTNYLIGHLQKFLLV